MGPSVRLRLEDLRAEQDASPHDRQVPRTVLRRRERERGHDAERLPRVEAPHEERHRRRVHPEAPRVAGEIADDQEVLVVDADVRDPARFCGPRQGRLEVGDAESRPLVPDACGQVPGQRRQATQVGRRFGRSRPETEPATPSVAEPEPADRLDLRATVAVALGEQPVREARGEDRHFVRDRQRIDDRRCACGVATAFSRERVEDPCHAIRTLPGRTAETPRSGEDHVRKTARLGECQVPRRIGRQRDIARSRSQASSRTASSTAKWKRIERTSRGSA